MVSIPYRYKQNQKTKQNKPKHKKVSIPYRYKQNYLLSEIGIYAQTSFNPLQVQTKLFPPIRHRDFLVQFQSPIGTNKTYKKQTVHDTDYFVSIPYRYKQNSRIRAQSGSLERAIHCIQIMRLNCQMRFNPLQVQTKRVQIPPEQSAGTVFQSPIGTNKTGQKQEVRYDRIPFQSPIGTNKTKSYRR